MVLCRLRFPKGVMTLVDEPTQMKVLITVLVVLAVFFVFAVFMVFSGVYNISTYNHDNRLMNWALDTAMTHSVEHHADGISAPRRPASGVHRGADEGLARRHARERPR